MNKAAWRRLKYGKAPVWVCCPRCGDDTFNLRTNVCKPCKGADSVSLATVVKAYTEALGDD